jgi:hypothetical protein
MAITECDRIPPALRRGPAAQYGGQQPTGHQAEVYADHFIAQHIADMTYSQLSAESMVQPNNTKLAALVNTVFKGDLAVHADDRELTRRLTCSGRQ